MLKCSIKCPVVMGARKRVDTEQEGRDCGLGEQRGKEVSSGRGPPGKNVGLPGQRGGRMGREVKLS